MDNARQTDFKLWALHSGFLNKDKLKSRGYLWDDKNWNITVTREDLENEIDWLRSEIYGNSVFEILQEKMTACNRFSVKNSKSAIMSY